MQAKLVDEERKQLEEDRRAVTVLCEATALGRAAIEHKETAEKWDRKLAEARQALEADWWKLETERGTQLRLLRDERLLLEQVRAPPPLLL